MVFNGDDKCPPGRLVGHEPRFLCRRDANPSSTLSRRVPFSSLYLPEVGHLVDPPPGEETREASLFRIIRVMYRDHPIVGCSYETTI